ncbi:MAG TPA: sialidase family protein [Polyangia bacterium]
MRGYGPRSWALAAVVVLAPHGARADGAFPNGQSVLAPADRPGEIILATNFGLVSTMDGGRTWLWSCEQAATSYGHLYQMGPAPADRLYAVSTGKLVFSDDDACDWQTAGGLLAAQLAEDLFVDPSDGARVLAAGLAAGDGGTFYTVLESTDGGATFDRTLYTAAPGDLVTGVEIAASDPTLIDVALSHGAAGAPTLARSTDGGATWALTDLTAAVGAGQLRIVAIDPSDADRVFLRAIRAAGDALAISEDNGSVTVPLTLPAGSLVAFIRTAAGTLLAAGTSYGGPVLYRSLDGGASFAPIAGAPPVLALGARAGTVYAATDSTVVPFAEASSTDEGETWSPGMAFTSVAAIEPCVKAACQSDCAARAAQQQWPAAMCAAAPPSADPPDAGLDAQLPGDVVVGQPVDASTVLDAGDVPRTPRPMGCSCAVTPAGPGGGALLLLAAGVLFQRRRRRP